MQKRTILIIDDSPVMSRFLAIFLEKKYEVIPFSDSTDALEAIKGGLSPDAIITDLDMPKLSGMDFIHAVRELDKNTPIAVISSNKESAVRIKCLESGADDYLAKPFHPAELDMRIGKLLLKSVPSVVEEAETENNEVEQRSIPVRSIFKEFIKAAAF